jgi:uncharacterized metal-binding protein
MHWWRRIGNIVSSNIVNGRLVNCNIVNSIQYEGDEKMADAVNKAACCGGSPKLIFACSGAADVGKISDLAARNLTAEGVGKMFCLAGIGGRVSGIMETTRSADTILVIDGCPLDCARLTLETAGFAKFEHIRLTDLGMEKGKTPATEENIAKVVMRGKSRLAG